MGKEIEKFLLMEDGQDFSTPQLVQLYPSMNDLQLDVVLNGERVIQGYLSLGNGTRLASCLNLPFDFEPKEARLRKKAGKFYFTLKGEGGLSRGEAEQEMDKPLFDTWWPATNGKRIDKIRLARPYEGRTLELDVYMDRELVIAEIEVPSVEAANSLIALGKDVTEDSRYKNKNLAK